MSNKMRPEPGKFDWYRKARVVNVEEFHPPLSPRLEVDPKRLARKMSETGADVVHIDPPGVRGPLYQRAHYRGGETRWRRVQRFVSDETVAW